MEDHRTKKAKYCPHCKAVVNDQTYRPFCCERCKMVDLSKWLNDSYAIPAVNDPVPEEDVSLEEENSET